MTAGCRPLPKPIKARNEQGFHVATSAFDSPYAEGAAKPPVSLHPAFPAIVALWFAALLGLGSLVLPGALLDRTVSATGLASLLPAAAPPLGMTARAIIALLGALGGAALGVAVARRVAGAQEAKGGSRAAKLAAGSRRPISVHDELGGEGVVNGEGLPISRRRALAISEDDRPSDFLYRAPLPGADPDAPALFAAAPIVRARADDDPAVEDEPLELSELAQEDDTNDTDGDPDMTDASEAPSAWPSHQHYPRGHEPLPFAAPSLARRALEAEPEPEPEPEAEPEPETAYELGTEPAPQLEAMELEESAGARADWQTAPLDGLGLVQLVQRLGATIERRREAMASADAQMPAAPPAPSPVFAEAGLEPAAPEDAVQAMAAFFGAAPEAEPEQDAPAPRPAFLRALSLPEEAEDEDEEADPDFSLPLRRSAGGGNDAAADDDEDGYGSLLGMDNPFAAPKSGFVRVDEPDDEPELTEPAVVFPGQEQHASHTRLFDPPGNGGAPAASAPPVPADADAALRAALATLQRMSGAA